MSNSLEPKLEKLKKKVEQLDLNRRHHVIMGSGFIWYMKAWEIKYSSDTLYRSRLRSRKKPNSQELLLLGFAFELLFKSFYLSLNQVGKLPEKLRTHSLEKLLLKTRIEGLNSFEISLLKKLSNFIWWQGRYPCALLPQQSNKVEISAREVLILRKMWRQSCRQMPEKIKKDFIETILKIKTTKE